MKNNNWKKLLSHSVEDADILAKNHKFQKHFDCIEDYSGRIYVDGESYSTDTLKLLYLEAIENVCSPAVLDFLVSLKGSVANELINEIFIEVASEQKSKTRFLSQYEKLSKLSKKTYTDDKSEKEHLNRHIVEDALLELGIKIRLNLVTKKIEVYGLEDLYELYSRSNILNALPLILLDHLRQKDVKSLGIGTKQIEQYIFIIADKNRYNPVHEMLKKAENDDAGNAAVLYALLGLNDDFHKSLVKKWFMQSIALAFNSFENPITTEGVLVLQGPQGSGKTSFFRRFSLNIEWFTEGAVIDVKNKDTLITALSTWICELGEIDSTLKREQSALKAFITRPIDKIRFPYSSADSELIRSTSFCGTVNPDKFLNDLTGSRRYWVVPVDSIDKKFLFSMTKEQIKDIWGYFYHLYKENPEGFRLDDDERKMLENQNSGYKCELKFEEELLDLLDYNLPVDDWINVTAAQLSFIIRGSNAIQIGKVLTRLSQNDERVKKNDTKKGRIYTVPVKKSLYNTLKVRDSER